MAFPSRILDRFLLVTGAVEKECLRVAGMVAIGSPTLKRPLLVSDTVLAARVLGFCELAFREIARGLARFAGGTLKTREYIGGDTALVAR